MNAVLSCHDAVKLLNAQKEAADDTGCYVKLVVDDGDVCLITDD